MSLWYLFKTAVEKYLWFYGKRGGWIFTPLFAFVIFLDNYKEHTWGAAVIQFIFLTVFFFRIYYPNVEDTDA